MIAITIMTLAFGAIYESQSQNLILVTKTKERNMAVWLVHNKMVEAEHLYEGKPFEELPKHPESEAFKAPFERYKWTREVKELKFPDLPLGGGKAGEGVLEPVRILAKTLTKYFNDSVRELIVTVSWQRGDVRGVGHRVDLSHRSQPAVLTADMKPRRRRQRQAAFTLIELMIALTILAAISLGIYDITAGTFEKRERIEAEGDFYNSLRVGARRSGARPDPALLAPGPGSAGELRQRSSARPGRLGTKRLRTHQRQRVQQRAGQQRNSHELLGPGRRRQRAAPLAPARRGLQVSFVSTSHVRIYRDSLESELVKVSYALEDAKTPDPNLVKGSKLLVKHESVDVFGDDEKESDSGPPLHVIDNVKSVQFEYYDADKDTWDKKWDTAGSDHKDVFPAIVKVTIEVYQPLSPNPVVVVQQYRPELNL